MFILFTILNFVWNHALFATNGGGMGHAGMEENINSSPTTTHSTETDPLTLMEKSESLNKLPPTTQKHAEIKLHFQNLGSTSHQDAAIIELLKSLEDRSLKLSIRMNIAVYMQTCEIQSCHKGAALEFFEDEANKLWLHYFFERKKEQCLRDKVNILDFWNGFSIKVTTTPEQKRIFFQELHNLLEIEW